MNKFDIKKFACEFRRLRAKVTTTWAPECYHYVAVNPFSPREYFGPKNVVDELVALLNTDYRSLGKWRVRAV